MKPEGGIPTLFISDLHLTPDEPATSERFFGFLDAAAVRARALYILGDLFEVWLGDDDLAHPWPAAHVVALRKLVDHGVPVHIMHGNRDFLLGEAFCQASGARLLPDPSIIDLYGTPTLLMHGDSLCTDDLTYQQFRRQVRGPAWQRQFLAAPLEERRVLANRMREQSEQAKGDKAAEIMDVNADALDAALRRHGCRRMIHGHTHRPARHLHQLGGGMAERWVLPDWYGGGGYLHCDGEGCRLVNPV